MTPHKIGPAVTAQVGPPPVDRLSKGHTVILYTQGLGESIKKICSKYGIKTHFKGNRTINQLLVKPIDKDPMEKKSGAISCTSVENLHAMKNI